MRYPCGTLSQPGLAFVRQVVGAKVGRYDLVRCIGQGAIGVVYEGVDRSLGRRVAVKILRSLPLDGANAKRAMGRFLREGRAAARVRHAHVVDVYDVGFEDGWPFLVMELVEGESLAQLLHREKKLSLERAVGLLLPVLSAVAELHVAGIVHRDVKPANILIDRSDACPKLADFGLSRFGDELSSTSRSGALLGTPAYMAPELILGQTPASEQSDQYAIGVTLYECVTGKKAFRGATDYELLGAIVEGTAEEPSRHERDLPKAFDEVAMRALHVAPQQRFGSVDDFAEALLPFASPSVRMRWRQEFVPDEASGWRAPVGRPRAKRDVRHRRVLTAILMASLTCCGLATLVVRARVPALGATQSRPVLAATSEASGAGATMGTREPTSTPDPPSKMPASAGRAASLAGALARQPIRATVSSPAVAAKAPVGASPVLGENGAPILDVP